jgi:FkbM family methyltransferase
MRWAQIISAIVRFRTLPRAERVFAGLPPRTWLSRPYLGSQLWVDVGRSSTERLLFLEGARLSPELDLLAGLLAPGNRVADVGANIGYYTLAFAAAVGPTGAVESIEPMPENLETLERNVRANDLRQVRVHRCAVGAEDRPTRLQPGFNATVNQSGTLEVPMRRLDSLLPDGVDLVKIDIEGYEGHALAGAQQLLSRSRPALFIELHPGLVEPPYSITKILDDLSGLYGEVDLWRPRPENSLASKVRGRYGPSRLERVRPDDPGWSALREGRHDVPFWAICRRPPRG